VYYNFPGREKYQHSSRDQLTVSPIGKTLLKCPNVGTDSVETTVFARNGNVENERDGREREQAQQAPIRDSRPAVIIEITYRLLE